MKFNRFSCCRNSRKHTVRRFIQSYWWISARSCNFSRTCSWKNHLHDFMKTGPWAPRLKCVFNILVLPIFALLPGFCFEEFFKTFYRNNKNHYVQFRTYKIHLNIQKIFSKIQRKIDDIGNFNFLSKYFSTFNFLRSLSNTKFVKVYYSDKVYGNVGMMLRY